MKRIKTPCRSSLSIALFFALFVACGEAPEEPDIRIGFKMHELKCEQAGIQAKLEASGIEGVCPLTVKEDRTVYGICKGVPTGVERSFRLVYYMVHPTGQEVQLAVVLAVIDLTEETRTTVTLNFPADQVNTNFDDDGDLKLNLSEFCEGTDPRDPNN